MKNFGYLCTRNSLPTRSSCGYKCGNSSVGRAQPCPQENRHVQPWQGDDRGKKDVQQIIAEIAQLVEHNLAKVGVASSSLVFRSKETTAEKSSCFFYL